MWFAGIAQEIESFINRSECGGKITFIQGKQKKKKIDLSIRHVLLFLTGNSKANSAEKL